MKGADKHNTHSESICWGAVWILNYHDPTWFNTLVIGDWWRARMVLLNFNMCWCLFPFRQGTCPHSCYDSGRLNEFMFAEESIWNLLLVVCHVLILFDFIKLWTTCNDCTVYKTNVHLICAFEFLNCDEKWTKAWIIRCPNDPRLQRNIMHEMPEEDKQQLHP